ncbi:MAG: Crp/Fnr family transcriptional regulator [Elusimicrobia bacterium]|nr:Crp/Fnr family transcriptional regulator [Elusimicrobiota bacterium]
MRPSIKPLQAIPLLRDFSREDWRRFQELVDARTYRPGNALFYQGREPLGLHFIVSGRVKLIKEDHSGRCQIVRIAHGPDFLGDRAFFAERAYACTGEVMEESEIGFLSSDRFWKFFGRNPNLNRLLAQRFAVELGRAEDYMHCLSACTINTRMAARLLKSLQAPGLDLTPKGEFVLAESRTELAQVLGTTPEAVSRALSAFCVKNVIAVSGRRVRVLNEDRLRLSACLHEPVS